MTRLYSDTRRANKKPVLIYVLKCPFTGAVRYVGQSTNPKARLRQHLSESRLGEVKSHKCDWIRSVLRKGRRPTMEIVRAVRSDECWKEVEQATVAYYRSIGCDLTNGTDGGDTAGLLTEEGRAKLAKQASERFGTPQGRATQSEMMKTLCADPEFRKARDEAAKRTRATAEYKARASARSKAKWADPKYREKMRLARLALNADPEFRAKLSAGATKAQADPEVRKMKAEAARKAWADPEIRERQTAALRAAHSKSHAAKVEV